MISQSAGFTQKAGAWELCPLPLIDRHISFSIAIGDGKETRSRGWCTKEFVIKL